MTTEQEREIIEMIDVIAPTPTPTDATRLREILAKLYGLTTAMRAPVHARLKELRKEEMTRAANEGYGKMPDHLRILVTLEGVLALFDAMDAAELHARARDLDQS
jgi:hypothetical protein